MGILYVVATPIGNLQDITLRALAILKSVDVILCEDTRVTRKLLQSFGIVKATMSYHQHSTTEKAAEIFELLSQGKNLALVTDAGTPGISDPGNELISFLLQKDQDLRIVPVPGPSAAIAVASVSGFPTDTFLFMGYPPHKKGRKKFFEEVAACPYPVIFYESPYRILKSLEELQAKDYNLQTVVGRELTKQFETFYRGSIGEVREQLEKEKIRGEFAVLVFRCVDKIPVES